MVKSPQSRSFIDVFPFQVLNLANIYYSSQVTPLFCVNKLLMSSQTDVKNQFGAFFPGAHPGFNNCGHNKKAASSVIITTATDKRFIGTRKTAEAVG
jgi:hypothetical protein